MSKNLIYHVAINFEVTQASVDSWGWYAKKYGHDFKVIDTPTPYKNRSPHWERYTVMERFPDYDNYLYVDADSIVSWNAPDFFEELASDRLYVVTEGSSLEWITNSIKGYQPFFPDVDLDWHGYFATGFLKFTSLMADHFAKFLDIHDKNADLINQMQLKTLRKGFDQTPFNYFVKQQEIPLTLIHPKYSLAGLVKRDILWNGMFTELGYVWQLNGISTEQRLDISNQLWNQIKENYE